MEYTDVWVVLQQQKQQHPEEHSREPLCCSPTRGPRTLLGSLAPLQEGTKLGAGFDTPPGCIWGLRIKQAHEDKNGSQDGA